MSYNVLSVTHDTDITTTLQAALDAQYTDGRRIMIPAGEYWISDKITLPNRSGAWLEGVGTGEDLTWQSQYAGNYTLLKATAEFSESAMFRGRGTEYDIGNFSILGNEKGTMDGIETYKSLGLGTGKWRIMTMGFRDLRYGFRAGQSGSEGNSDNLHFDWVTGQNITAAFYGQTEQCLDVKFSHLRLFVGCDYGLLYDGGGVVTVESALISTANQQLLQINDTVNIGRNNNRYQLSSIQIDAAAADTFVLVECDSPTGCHIHVDGLMMAYNGSAPQNQWIQLTGGNTMHMENCRASFDSMLGITDSGRIPKVMLENCQFYRVPNYTNLDLRARNCSMYEGAWVEIPAQYPI